MRLAARGRTETEAFPENDHYDAHPLLSAASGRWRLVRDVHDTAPLAI